MIHPIEFWLPFPPSANRLWRSVGGSVIRSREYKNWKRDACTAAAVMQNLGKGPVIGIYELECKLSVKLKRGDADNRLKALHDIAKEIRLIVDDKFCRRTSVEWATIDHDCLVRLTGEIAYKDQWEFANALAARQIGQKKAQLPRQAFGLPLRKLPSRG